MKHRKLIPLVVGAASLLAAAGTVVAKDFNKLLKGQYAFAGESTCLVSRGGFDADLTPVDSGPFPFTLSFSSQGVRTFNGDGTGTVTARTVAIRHPSETFNRGSASASDIYATFTYTVTPELVVQIENLTLQGTNVVGTTPGPTFTTTNFPLYVGLLARDYRTLSLAHVLPVVETQTYFNADNTIAQTQYRICNRPRILLERKGG